MTRLGIVGGKLQGMEAAYLARKAGIQTVVIDANPSAPALSLADEAVNIDVTINREKATKIFADCDAVLPANENLKTLSVLSDIFARLEVPLIFDMDAYMISSSKIRSNDFMRRLGIPMPRSWPECGFPAVVKPSGESGSVGVTRAACLEELIMGVEQIGHMHGDPVIQEFLEGPSISIEVIADGQDAIPLVTTDIFLDDKFDCKMVGSPWEDGSKDIEEVFSEAGRRMATELGLRGIMDVEAIVSNGVPRILEIDARIPSQTPTAVLHSHGINMIEMLIDMSVHDRLEQPARDVFQCAYYEHVRVDRGEIRSCGEGSFADIRRPQVVQGLFGSDEMITDYEPGKESWGATIINSATSFAAAQTKRRKVLQAIMDQEGLTNYIDPQPEAYA